MATIRFFFFYLLSLPLTLTASLKTLSPESGEWLWVWVQMKWQVFAGGKAPAAVVLGMERAAPDVAAWWAAKANVAWAYFMQVSKGDWHFWLALLAALLAAAAVGGVLTAFLAAMDGQRQQNRSV